MTIHLFGITFTINESIDLGSLLGAGLAALIAFTAAISFTSRANIRQRREKIQDELYKILKCLMKLDKTLRSLKLKINNHNLSFNDFLIPATKPDGIEIEEIFDEASLVLWIYFRKYYDRLNSCSNDFNNLHLSITNEMKKQNMPGIPKSNAIARDEIEKIMNQLGELGATLKKRYSNYK